MGTLVTVFKKGAKSTDYDYFEYVPSKRKKKIHTLVVVAVRAKVRAAAALKGTYDGKLAF